MNTGWSLRSGQNLSIAVAVAAAVAVGAIVGIVLARSPHSARTPSAARRSGRSAVVGVRRSRFGRILIDARGRTLYLLTTDRDGRSGCYGGCARVWPPALARGRPHAAKGVTAAALTTVARAGGTRQLVYHRHPLYTLVADKRAGQINGQGYDGVWFLVSPSGHRILKGAPRSSGSGY